MHYKNTVELELLTSGTQFYIFLFIKTFISSASFWFITFLLQKFQKIEKINSRLYFKHFPPRFIIGVLGWGSITLAKSWKDSLASLVFCPWGIRVLYLDKAWFTLTVVPSAYNLQGPPNHLHIPLSGQKTYTIFFLKNKTPILCVS